MFTMPIKLQQRVRCDKIALPARISSGLHKNLGDEEQQLSLVQEESGILKMILSALEFNSIYIINELMIKLLGIIIFSLTSFATHQYMEP